MELKCPQCDSQRIAGGRVFSQPDYISPGAYFRPKELKPFALTGINIRFDNRFFGCVDCGFIWAKVNSKKLTEVIATKGNKSVKARLGLANEKEHPKDQEASQDPEPQEPGQENPEDDQSS